MRNNGIEKSGSCRSELRDRILDTASTSFATYGIKHITMDNIATTLSISKRTLYEIFADKEALLMECVMKRHLEADEYLKSIYDGTPNVLEVLLKFYLWNIEQFHRINKQFFKDLKKYPKVYEILMRRHNRDSESVVAFFEDGVRQGFFRNDINFAIANLLVDEQLNLLMTAKVCKEYSFPEVYEAIMFTYLRGISTEKGAFELEKFIQEYRKKYPLIK